MDDTKRMDRREAIRWMIAAGATVSMLNAPSFGASGSSSGYGTDPKLVEVYKPGDLWPLTFTAAQHRTVSALCDIILPADEKSPSASELKVPDFFDEWISAPYPPQQADRQIILDGITWLDAESARRFSKPFHDLNSSQHNQICDDICSVQNAGASFQAAARFFAKFRDLAMGAFFSSPDGMRDIQYLGNVPLTKFDGPPPEVLAYLKLRP
jgi:hypothetical protein